MSKTLAIIGKDSGLAKGLKKNLQNNYQVELFGKEQFDFEDPSSIDNLAKKIKDFDVIINCVGLYNQDSWNTLMVNAVAPARLIEQLIQHKSNSHLVMIGSHSASWTSWPGIDQKRLWYNISKSVLELIVKGCEQSRVCDLKFTLFNASRFQSPMSEFSGHPVEQIVDIIEKIISQPIPPLIYELPSYNV